jgi:hypothetical protein
MLDRRDVLLASMSAIAPALPLQEPPIDWATRRTSNSCTSRHISSGWRANGTRAADAALSLPSYRQRKCRI